MQLRSDQYVTITDFLGQAHRYVVVRSLGDGYLADVYLMHDLRDGTPVVVKVLKRRHAEADHKTAEFLREADLLQQLAHLPEVVDSQAPGKGEITLQDSLRLPCTMQEYVEYPYRPVPEFVETGLDEQTGLTICRQFASLLRRIHSQNIVYTDLKLEHVYWNGSQIKVIDWNVVKDLSGADRDALNEAITKELRAFGQAMYYLFTGQSTVRRAEGASVTALISGDFSDTHIDFTDSTTDKDLSLGTKLIIERSLDGDGQNSYSSAAAIEEALAQHLLRLNHPTTETVAHMQAARSKGLAALQAADYEDAVVYFTEAAHSTPGLITQSYLVAAHIRQDEGLPDRVKDQVEENLAVFRVNLEEGDLTTALDALETSQASLAEHQAIKILHQLTEQLADAVARADEALEAADYDTAQRALRSGIALEPSVSFLQERLQAVEAFRARLRTGMKALEAGQFSEAAIALESLLDHMPRSAAIEERWVTARLGQGQAALDRAAFTEARDAFQAILDREPGNEEAQAGLEVVEARQQRLQELESWLVQGRTALQVGDFEKSLQCVNAALELQPEHAEARQLLADVQQARQAERSRRVRRWLEKGHQAMADRAYSEAIDCYEQAAALDPESEADVLRARAEAAQARTEQFQALLHKAHAAFRGEDYGTAIEYFEGAVDLFPEDLDARRGLTLARQRQAEARAHEMQSLLAAGRAALSQGSYEDAVEHFERAVDMGGGSETAEYIETAFQIRDLVQAAQAAESRGELQEALKRYARAVEIDPLPGLEAQLSRIRAEVHAATKEQVNGLVERASAHLDSAPEQSVAWLEQARDLDPGHEGVAELLLKAKKELHRRQLELRDLLESGQSALDVGDGATAEEAFAQALALDSENEEARAGLAQAQRLHGHLQTAERSISGQDYEAAAAELEQALEIAGDSLHVRERWRQARCEALLRQARRVADGGSHARALSLIEEALALQPDHPTGPELQQKVRTQLEAARRAEEAAAQQAMLEEVASLTATAEARVADGDYHGASQAMESALELMPDNADLMRRRQEIAQQKARYERACGLLSDGRRLELRERYAEAVEVYEIAARLSPDSGLEAEAQVRADQAHNKHRQQRWRHLVRRFAGFSIS